MAKPTVIRDLGELLDAWWTSRAERQASEPERPSTRVDVPCPSDREKARVGALTSATIRTLAEVKIAQRILTPETRKKARSCHCHVF